MNLFLLVFDVFLFVFWKKLKTPERNFELSDPKCGDTKKKQGKQKLHKLKLLLRSVEFRMYL